MKKPWEGQSCQYRRCKNKAQGYHCKSCNAFVCKEHQEPSGYGNHGGLVHPFEIIQNEAWRKIK